MREFPLEFSRERGPHHGSSEPMAGHLLANALKCSMRTFAAIAASGRTSIELNGYVIVPRTPLACR